MCNVDFLRKELEVIGELVDRIINSRKLATTVRVVYVDIEKVKNMKSSFYLKHTREESESPRIP